MAEPQHRIVIGDIDIPFGRLVAFFVKATLAAIPAAVIVWIILMMMWFVRGNHFRAGLLAAARLVSAGSALPQLFDPP